MNEEGEGGTQHLVQQAHSVCEVGAAQVRLQEAQQSHHQVLERLPGFHALGQQQLRHQIPVHAITTQPQTGHPSRQLRCLYHGDLSTPR